MAVLSNRALVEALDARRLVIEPRPEPPPDKEQTPFDTSSVDLHLSSEIYVPKQGLSLTFDLHDQDLSRALDAVYRRAEIPEQGWVLPPRQLILGRTIERVDLPLGSICLAARIEGRSSFARTGLLVHFTAPTIHPGFEGNITLEIINLGEIPLTLRPRLPVCQLIVETVEGSPIRKDSQFHGQARPIG